MPIFFTERDTDSTERMDDPSCDRQALYNTYRQFSTINSILSGWKKIYKSHIKPLAKRADGRLSLLDIGFGGGDIPIKLENWARRDNISLKITAIDTDQRAIDFIHQVNTPPQVTFRHCSSTKLLQSGARFDIVISNHLLHHLHTQDFHKLLDEAKRLSKKRVLFNDIERSDTGYLLFNLLSRPLFRSSFITQDGLTSIKRSYTLQELRHQIPGDWNVQRLFPFRLLLSYQHE